MGLWIKTQFILCSEPIKTVKSYTGAFWGRAEESNAILPLTSGDERLHPVWWPPGWAAALWTSCDRSVTFSALKTKQNKQKSQSLAASCIKSYPGCGNITSIGNISNRMLRQFVSFKWEIKEVNRPVISDELKRKELKIKPYH